MNVIIKTWQHRNPAKFYFYTVVYNNFNIQINEAKRDSNQNKVYKFCDNKKF